MPLQHKMWNQSLLLSIDILLIAKEGVCVHLDAVDNEEGASKQSLRKYGDKVACILDAPRTLYKREPRNAGTSFSSL